MRSRGGARKTGPVAPRDASTVLLLRDGEQGLEVFMERRHLDSDFVGGAYVFPGGRVDAADRIDERLCVGLTDTGASRRLGIDEGGLAFWAAAIRECFEEAGVLLAYADGSRLLDFSDDDDRFRRHRDALNRGEISLGELAAQEELRLATDRIEYWAHWITPEGTPKRYDTRFFVAEAPHNQTAAHDDWELTSSAWVRPQEAIDRAKRQEWMIILPTLANLKRLAEHASADAALAAAREQTEIPAIMPKIRRRDGRIELLLPGDAGYDTADTEATASGEEVWPRQRGNGETGGRPTT